MEQRIQQKKEIQWITVRKTDGDERKAFTKEITLTKELKKAVIRFQSDCVCGVFVNGAFLISGTGHYPERVNCHEITHALKTGQNTICLELGTRYYQQSGRSMKERRGYWYSNVAFELELQYADGEICYIPTDCSWKAETEKGVSGETCEIIHVTDADYERLWRSAAVWVEEPTDRSIPDAVVNVTGNAYAAYVKASGNPKHLLPKEIYETNMTEDELAAGDLPINRLARTPGEERYVIYDFGRLVVGFAEIDLWVSEEADLIHYVEWSEKPEDFAEDSRRKAMVDRLSLFDKVSPSDGKRISLYRRASRYLKLVISGTDRPVKICDFSIRPCMYPVSRTGWFSCDDPMLNEIWEVGKYTLHVNKQQEYESCPRNEMKFFSGDGIIAALTDYYAFGDHALVDASLSLHFPASSVGKVQNFEEANISGLWDYPGWWVVMLYNEYKHYGDLDVLKKHYANAARNLEWYISRMNKRNLIYSIQRLMLPFCVESGGVEWTDAGDRLGEKASLNSMFYKTLLCMSELGTVMKDSRADYWQELAEKVRCAINTHLWSEEKQAFIDREYDYIPQDGNALAVLFGVADEERSKAALKTMQGHLWSEYGSSICDKSLPHSRGGAQTIAPLMCTYEAEANFLHRDSGNALDLIRRCWGSMLKKGARTFWEYAPNNEGEWSVRSHAWAAGCTYLLGAYVLGVRPGNNGWQKMHFDPQPDLLNAVKGVVPTPLGEVAVRYSVRDGQKHYVLAIPQGMDVDTTVPTSELEIVRY